MRKWIVAVMLVGSMAGCATAPPQATSVRPGTAIANPWMDQSADSGEMVLTRDSGFVGLACTMHAFLDGEPIGDLRTAQRVIVYPPVGEHTASVKTGAPCLNLLVSTDINIRQGSVKALRAGIGASGDLKLEPGILAP